MRRTCIVCDAPLSAGRSDALTCSTACRQHRSRFLRAITPPLPPGQFDLLYADPPWRWISRTPAGQGRSPSQHYFTMDVVELARLPIAELAARDAYLAMWAYDPRLREAFALAEAWGFPQDAGVAFTWCKTTKLGKPAFGLGHTTRKSTEQCLLFKRGNGLLRQDCGVRQRIDTDNNVDPPQVIEALRREHSRKPDEAAERLERLYGAVRRIELFACRERPGWTAWGNEVSCDRVAARRREENQAHAERLLRIKSAAAALPS